ncbi:phosphate acyltransferase PlsX [Helicobacter sp.]|uniref:phosphate acyltransferase PlsX n=1 Tax=Helicobacter sp. TaxID=218 RepID=UPI0025C350EC|nr:phosphate acyltransferase PlsX [Helicobacter sp.]MCI5968519.1 phosphate acyltransferase PlsX [Helicobacter sp.]MDY2584728.1 phosphate acyltransferase PlsX [Helicobacter sp.]
MMKIAVDAMGGDFGSAPLVQGSLQALKERDFTLVLVGDAQVIKPLIPVNLQGRVEVVHCDDYIAMEDGATSALKRKGSSIYVAMEMLKNKVADAVVSAGHSGATMSLATLKIGRLNNVLRPAICTLMPRIDGNKSLVLDVGANADCKPENLFEFGIMGYEYAKAILNYPKVRIGLLANGEEECKGNEMTKIAFELLKKHPNFVGNVEGNNIFDGNVEVIVCDGFVGNAVLKASEGVANSISFLLKKHIKASPIGIFGALFMQNVFKKLKKQIDYAEYGGAPLLGVNGNVIICHGKSNAKAMKNAVFQAILAYENAVNHNIEIALEQFKD